MHKKQTTQNTAKQKLAWFSRLLTILGQETRWAYSTMLQRPHGPL